MTATATPEPLHLATDVLVIGAGGAGMYAAIEAARGGASVLLADRALIGRGGATVMAMMTVAVALGQDGPDDPAFHYADTLAAGRGLCDAPLSQLLCEDGPACILEMDAWGVGWARNGNAIKAAFAPGHDRPRCVYVDFLNTGPAVSKTLRTALHKQKGVRRVGDLLIVDLVKAGDRVTGAVAIDMSTGAAVTIAAGVTIIATGGLTRLYRRNSASANMGGDGYALGLRAGAKLIDMEFVQFFPIGHLAPRMIGLDPIMWDPFRYKLGGRLLNGRMEDFIGRYGTEETGRYITTRDQATYAITKEVEAGRGSPHGGAYLSFMHLTEADLKAAFGPVIDRIRDNGIDLTKMPVEVAPIAHYHMGGISVDRTMATAVPGLLAAGEAVGAGWSAEVAPGGNKCLALDDAQTATVKQVSDYFNALGVLKGAFVQTGADAKRQKGKFYVKRPGRFRFDYAPPLKQVIVSDGQNLAIQDLDLQNEDRVELDQTPFRLLLKKDVDLARDACIGEVQTAEDLVVLALEDRSPDTPGKIRLFLAAKPALELKEWVTTDAQGQQTRVELSDLDKTDDLKPDLFTITPVGLTRDQPK